MEWTCKYCWVTEVSNLNHLSQVPPCDYPLVQNSFAIFLMLDSGTLSAIETQFNTKPRNSMVWFGPVHSSPGLWQTYILQ